MTAAETKASLRKELRARRKAYAAALSPGEKALLFYRPPVPLLDLVPAGAVVGLYHASADEAPTAGYARWLSENLYRIALPRFASRDAPMEFAVHSDPFAGSDLEAGPFGMEQPEVEAETVVPSVLFVPLLGFTDEGHRIGQGGGHYDRWLADHPETTRIGLAWDCQLVDELPTEPHDVTLNAVVTPTRIYGPF